MRVWGEGAVGVRLESQPGANIFKTLTLLKVFCEMLTTAKKRMHSMMASCVRSPDMVILQKYFRSSRNVNLGYHPKYLRFSFLIYVFSYH